MASEKTSILKMLINIPKDNRLWLVVLVLFVWFGYREYSHFEEKRIITENADKRVDKAMAAAKEANDRSDANNEKIVQMAFKMVDVLREGEKRIYQKDSIINQKLAK